MDSLPSETVNHNFAPTETFMGPDSNMDASWHMLCSIQRVRRKEKGMAAVFLCFDAAAHIASSRNRPIQIY
jgi:hypothetical protein